ncbi:OmpA family protein [Mesorhizobium sp. BAC0120]|uniref:OmpA family protein n=1 Tax=Mesorhizobium sp. BAC0120 TaxID=3090670 RepID=UPI00298CCB8F|nr:OmpA family protein [Mesorhizobium sp. BAC0120]MDW6022446.1 OmpA family protein [Mesorhizobium sp. BAC0120]
MKCRFKLLAGSALGLLLAAAPGAWGLANAASPHEASTPARHVAGAMMLAQDETAPSDEPEEQLRRQKGKQQAAPEQATPEQEQPRTEEESPRRKKGKQQATPEGATPEQQQPSAQEEPPRRQKSEQQAAPEQATPEQQQPSAQEEPPRKQKGKQRAAPEQATPEQQQPPAQEESPRKQKGKQRAAPEQATPEQQQPQAQEESPRKQKGRQQGAPEEAPPASQAEPAPQAEPNVGKPKSKTRVEQQTQEAEPEKAPAPESKPVPPKSTTPAEPETPNAASGEPAPQGTPTQPQEAAPTPHKGPGKEPEGKGGDTNEPQAAPEQPGTQPDSTVQPDSGSAKARPDAAPMLDSAKEAPAAPAGRNRRGTAETMGGEAEAQPPRPATPPGPPPADDRAAQEAARPAELQPLTAERGRRIAEPPPPIESRRRPQGVDVVRKMGDRVVVQFNNQNFVESSDRPRLTRQARDVQYEDLPRNRIRETVVREDGTRVVTIRNSYGDIVRRSRITPDGREYVLAYVDDRYSDRLEDWRDPGLELPPMQLDVPEEDYILDADNVGNPDTYYEFLERPPVERVKRLYSVDEVKRSARIRDMVPRVELTTVNFGFGSAAVAESEISKLEGVAEAMERILKKNPAETFLIEGHTDAVGSDVANLALSDQRAEAVAQALTNVFDIPPENLATQGYGERFLKIRTDGPEQANRRVVIRRITPLVAPVASAD